PHRPAARKGLRRPGGRCPRETERWQRIRRNRWAAHVPADEEERRDREAVLPETSRVCSGKGRLAVGSIVDRRDGWRAEQAGWAAVGRGAGDRAEPAVPDDSGKRFLEPRVTRWRQ